MRIRLFNREGREISKEVKILKWIDFDSKKVFEHYMIKEIYEQPLVSKILIDSLETEQSDIFDKFLDEIQKSEKIVFIAAGSSYHSSLIGSYLLRKAGYDARSVIASEYDSLETYDKDTLLVAVSQSGETMDVILALKSLKTKVKNMVSIVNVPYSTIQRMSSVSLEIKAGPEKCVAATKTYTNQVVLFYYLARSLGIRIDINRIPKNIEKTIERNEKNIIGISRNLINENSIYILGRSINYFAALEIALKLKEISYIHAEAMPAGELKHGTLALIEPGVKVITLDPSWDPMIRTNIEEVKARGGEVISISENFYIPNVSHDFSLYSVIIGQLLTYYTAKFKGLPIDKPRNLAKSVTVR